MFKFKNIDSFTAGRFERMGMLKGKRWYTGIQEISEDEHEFSLVLFKPKRKEHAANRTSIQTIKHKQNAERKCPA